MRKYTYLLLLLLWLPLTLCASANAGSYSADKFYTIAMKSNSSSYISEESDGTLVVTSYDVTKRIFWQFIPTSKANCYYIRNSASGNYIGSCNVAQSRASLLWSTISAQTEISAASPVRTVPTMTTRVLRLTD